MKLSYSATSYITGFISFVVVWVYAISQWGFLIGITLGWIPAMITAFLAGLLWPLALFLLGLGLLVLVGLLVFTTNFLQSEIFLNIVYVVGFIFLVYAIVEGYKEFTAKTLPKIKSQGFFKTLQESETYKKETPATWVTLIVVILIWVGLLIFAYI